MRLELRNVRSFCSVPPVDLRPLTLLVGENSTGKTTFLSMLSHVHQALFPSVRPNFNVPPFDLGTYDSIATFKGGSYGRAGEFSVGFTETARSKERRVVATYESYKGQPQLRELIASGEEGEVTIAVDKESLHCRVSLRIPSKEHAEFNFDLKRSTPDLEYPMSYMLQVAVSESLRQKSTTKLDFRDSMQLMHIVRSADGVVTALSPVRTKPRRTYDEFSDEFDPEGDHVPVLLSRLGQDDADSESKALIEALREFGEDSALYRRIRTKHFGHKPSDPFQIQVTVAGPPSNLSDVGYGVSQALPIIVQSVLSAKAGRLLVQQPEIHLHPRGQAALGSFFAKLVAREKKQLVVETHSDYLLDRIRLEVARKTLKPEQVQILFFEKPDLETFIHAIGLDERGNVVAAPGSYRRFFLEEEEDLFTRTAE
jgi:hypothetical protein